MTKVKWGFSLILVFFIVGILSTVAFAASVVYTLKAVQNGSGLEVSFTGNPADVGGYNLLVKDGSNNTIQTDPITLNSSYIGTLNITGLTVGNTYTLQLYKQSDSLTLLSKASVVITDGNNASVPNSNQTGYRNLKKQRVGQNMHGFYQNNTNSCATCHQTHTAKNGNALLFKDGVYDTCTACHDGTTAASIDSVAGTFNVSDDVDHGSFHQADGSLQVSAAPGGHKTLDTTGMDTTTTNEATTLYDNTWGSKFDCASCHNPHGGGSAGENNLNEDPLGWGKVPFVSTGTKDQHNGKLFAGRTIYTTVPETLAEGNNDTYILVREGLGTTGAPSTSSTKTNIGYLYYRAGITSNNDSDGNPIQIIQTYRWDGNEYTPDYSLWLRDQGYEAPPFSSSNTVLFDSINKDISTGLNTNIYVVWRDGFAYGSGVANVTKYDLSVGIDVEGTNNDVASLYDPSDPNYVVDSGTEMSKFCTACHTDYMSNPQTGIEGVLTNKNANYRHTGITDDLTCVRCHFAHGTELSMMVDKNGEPSTNDQLSSLTHSSALRRYINFDSCNTGGCHINDPVGDTGTTTNTTPSTTDTSTTTSTDNSGAGSTTSSNTISTSTTPSTDTIGTVSATGTTTDGTSTITNSNSSVTSGP